MKPSNSAAAVRHILTFLGGYLAAQGIASDAEVQEVIGAAMTLGGFAWSMWEKYHVRRALAAGSNPEPPAAEPR